MNRREHYKAAEEYLGDAEEIQTEAGQFVPGHTHRADLLALAHLSVLHAQVHATLATSELIPMPVSQSIRLCGCAFLPNQHIRGASCPPVGPVPSDGPGQTS